jgi:hypothetical protein
MPTRVRNWNAPVAADADGHQLAGPDVLGDVIIL